MLVRGGATRSASSASQFLLGATAEVDLVGAARRRWIVQPCRPLILAAAATTILGQAAISVAPSARAADAARLQTSRMFQFGAGHATRAFTFRERAGVILLNRLTVPHGVRAVVKARIPGVAGARVQSWPSRNQPALSCRRQGAFDVCTQAEERCPMPGTTWHFRLDKLSGPAGAIRFDYIVAPPPESP